MSTVIAERDVLGLALAGEGDDAHGAAAAWQVLADGFGIVEVELVVPGAQRRGRPRVGARRACTRPVARAWWRRAATGGRGGVLGVVGEVDPRVLAEFGLDAEHRRVGWLEVDLEALLTDVPRRSVLVSAVSRFPSSDIDLAFVVGDAVPAAAVEKTLRQAGGELLESLALFDVYRGPGVPAGTRSLAYRLRLCAPDRTLTDQEVAEVRARCIARGREGARGAAA